MKIFNFGNGMCNNTPNSLATFIQLVGMIKVESFCRLLNLNEMEFYHLHRAMLIRHIVKDNINGEQVLKPQLVPKQPTDTSNIDCLHFLSLLVEANPKSSFSVEVCNNKSSFTNMRIWENVSYVQDKDKKIVTCNIADLNNSYIQSMPRALSLYGSSSIPKFEINILILNNTKELQYAEGMEIPCNLFYFIADSETYTLKNHDNLCEELSLCHFMTPIYTTK